MTVGKAAETWGWVPVRTAARALGLSSGLLEQVLMGDTRVGKGTRDLLRHRVARSSYVYDRVIYSVELPMGEEDQLELAQAVQAAIRLASDGAAPVAHKTKRGTTWGLPRDWAGSFQHIQLPGF